MKPLADPSANEQWPSDDETGRHRIAWWLARNVMGRDAVSLVEAVVLNGMQTDKILELRVALAKLAAHYCQAGYQQNLDDYIASEERKANEWLLSSSLCQQKPPLGWNSRRLSTACRSLR